MLWPLVLKPLGGRQKHSELLGAHCREVLCPVWVGSLSKDNCQDLKAKYFLTPESLRWKMGTRIVRA